MIINLNLMFILLIKYFLYQLIIAPLNFNFIQECLVIHDFLRATPFSFIIDMVTNQFHPLAFIVTFSTSSLFGCFQLVV